MKKFISTLAVFLTAGTFLNFSSNANCADTLVDQLESCFDTGGMGALDVNVIDGNLLVISGTIPASLRDAAQACIDAYNAGAASCPSAPTIVYGTPPPPNYGTAESHPVRTGSR